MAETTLGLAAAQEVRQTLAPRLAWIDLIRAGGAFLVTLAHIVLYPALKGSGPLWAQTSYYAVSRIAVPLFFMASGYLLLGRQEPLGIFFRKRAARVFIPFLVWSYVYFAWYGGFDQAGFRIAGLVEGLGRILRGPRAAHLWFFYVLIGLYLVTPVLRVFTSQARVRDLAYFSGVWFLLDPFLSMIQHTTSLQIGFEFQFFTGYIGYFVLGYLLGHIELRPRWTIAAAVTVVVSFAFLFLSIYMGVQLPKYDQFYEGYLSVPVVLLTAGAFYLIRAFGDRVPRAVVKWLLPFSAASLGIYLLHVIVLDAADKYLSAVLPFLRTGSTIWAMPLVAIAAYVVCFVGVSLLQKIPILKYSVP